MLNFDKNSIHLVTWQEADLEDMKVMLGNVKKTHVFGGISVSTEMEADFTSIVLQSEKNSN